MGLVGRLAGPAVLVALISAAAASPASAGPAQSPTRAESVSDAYQFLDEMMDLYASGAGTRLVQSFSGCVIGEEHYTEPVTYHDALMIDAYLAEGPPEALSRAETISDGLLYVQANAPARAGCLATDY